MLKSNNLVRTFSIIIVISMVIGSIPMVTLISSGQGNEVTEWNYEEPATIELSLDGAVVSETESQAQPLSSQVIASEELNEATSMEYHIPVIAGWNLISLPVIPDSTDLLSVLDDAGGDTTWDRVKCYNSSLANPWESFALPLPPVLNRLDTLTRDRGIWVHILDPGSDGELVVSGNITGITNIYLRAGWNLVGYPTLASQQASSSLVGVSYDRLERFDPVVPYITEMLDTEYFSPGNGYWIHVTSDCIWTVYGTGDTVGPVTSLAAATPDPTAGVMSVTLTANVDDTTTGGSNISQAEYFIGSGEVADHVVISEVAAEGPGGAWDEFVELYNPTANPIDIGEWKIQYIPQDALNVEERFQFPPGVIIQPYSYMLISNVKSGHYSGPDADYTYESEGFRDYGSHVRIGPSSLTLNVVDANVVDLVGWGDATVPEGGSTAPVPSPSNDWVNQSIERKATPTSTNETLSPGGAEEFAGNGNDTDVNGNDWIVRGIRNPQNSSAPQEIPGGYSGSNGTGIPMNAVDGTFDEIIEDVTVNVDITGWADGVYYFYVHGMDEHGNWGPVNSYMLTVTDSPDIIGPVTSSVSATPSPTVGATTLTLTADVDETTTGGANIAEAEYFVDTVGADGTGTAMNAQDGAFDEVLDPVTINIDVSGWTDGSYTLYVHGRDSLGNWGATDSVILTVSSAPDTEGPITSSVIAAPNPTAGAITVSLTANIDDTTTGGSTISEAEYFISGGSGGGGSGLVISQYIETDSGVIPKGLEIWNAGDTSIDFSVTNLVILLGRNGAVPSPYQTIDTGTLAAGEVIVCGTTDLTPDYEKAYDHNGDDSFVIELDGVVQDVFGDPGTGDPGTGWSGSGVQTYNQNIQLKDGISTGDTDGWTDPSERFEIVSTTPSILPDGIAGFGTAPSGGGGGGGPGANGTGTAMSAQDGAFEEIGEDVIASVDVSGLTEGDYTIYVHGNDSSGNWGDFDSFVLTVSAGTGPDTTGPVTSNVIAAPNPTSGATTVTLTADVDDTTTGGNTMAAAEYFVDTIGADGTGTAMNAQDGTFDEILDPVTIGIDVSGWSDGSYTLYVHGRDSVGNWGATDSVLLTVSSIGSEGPVITYISATPNPTAGQPVVTFLATVDDTTTGGDNIAEAEFFVDTIGANGTGTPMSADDGTFDEVSEDVIYGLVVIGWPEGTYTLYVHGKDVNNNWGAMDSIVIQVTSSGGDTLGPITSSVLASPDPVGLDGTSTLTANVDDTTTGGANIAGAEYFIGGGGSGLVISQYVETDDGTIPKGIEIWNAGSSPITFDSGSNRLVVKKGTNGGTPAEDWYLESGTLAAGAVIVVGTSDMSPDYEEPFTFNGDDSLVLELGGVVQDVFGIPGSDPGSAWTGGSVSTANQNIQLIDGIGEGDTDGWTDPSERFEVVSTNPSGAGGLDGFGTAPTGGGGGDHTNGTGTTMIAQDGTFDEVNEDVTVTIDTTGWSVGTYSIYVHGRDALGNWGDFDTYDLEVADLTAPTFAGLVSVVDQTQVGTLELSWGAATDDSTPITYNIYMATASGGQNFGSPGYTTTGTSYTVNGLTNGQPYYFVVRAEDAYGNEDTNIVERSGTPTGSVSKQKYAVIAGISDYDVAAPDLSYCDEDATDWYNYLTNPDNFDDGIAYTCWVYGDTHPTNYPQYDGIASEYNVKAALNNMVSIAGSSDTIAFIFSGHGDGNFAGSSNVCCWDSGSGDNGESGDLYDTELAAILDDSIAESIFVFLDSCLSGGFGDNLMAMPNSAAVYLSTTCDYDGYGYDDDSHSNGLWTYYFLQYALENHYDPQNNPDISMETVFTYAYSAYPWEPDTFDQPQEFDGNPSQPFYL